MGTMGWITLSVIVLIGLWLVMTYNGLVSLRQRCRQAFSDIDVQLKQRHDLVPNLVETVKGYAAHERGTLEAVIQARNAAIAAQGPAAQAQAEGMLQGALRQLFALAEAYPDLKANQNFQQLQSELADLENKIAAARRFFRGRVQRHARELPGRAVRPVDGLRPTGVLQPRGRRARCRSHRPAGEVLSPQGTSMRRSPRSSGRRAPRTQEQPSGRRGHRPSRGPRVPVLRAGAIGPG